MVNGGSVVVSALQEIDAIVAHEVDDAVLLRESPRPGVSCEMAQRLRFADPAKRVSHDIFDENEDP